MSQTLASRLRQSFRTHADRIAVYAGESTVTYAELEARADGVASALGARGIGSGHRVGLWIEKSADGLAVLLGTLYSGAAYVPLDVRAPWQRSLKAAANADLSALAVDRIRLPLLAEACRALPGLRLVLETERVSDEPRRGGSFARAPRESLPGDLHRRSVAELRADPAPRAGESMDPENPAYVLYTSGSTGEPKGVVLSHRAALGFADWCLRTFEPQPSDRMISHAPWHFDLSTFDLFVTLLSGASVRLLTSTESMLGSWIARNLAAWRISVWYSVPSALITMLEHGLDQQLWPQARLVLFAGEAFPTPRLVQLRHALPGVPLYNLFGPTETNVCTYYEVKELCQEETKPIPIGRVCEHLEGMVLDDELREVPPGTEGDLWIAGPNLMTGYWRDAVLTARRLRLDPRPGQRGLCYNTGDRVLVGPDGNLIFRGRRDHLVKVRGYRVELGEIESALYNFPGLAEAAVVAVPEASTHHLVAYLRWKDRTKLPELITHCRERLPLYMVPEEWKTVSRLPRTSSGKLDRGALSIDADQGL